jgi:hypothetical protein
VAPVLARRSGDVHEAGQVPPVCGGRPLTGDDRATIARDGFVTTGAALRRLRATR